MRKFKKLTMIIVMALMACVCLFGATACNILNRGDRDAAASVESSSADSSSVVCEPHDWKSTVVPATCTKAGSETLTCRSCGFVKVNSIKKLDHSYVVIPAKAATCTEDGYYEYKECSGCGLKQYYGKDKFDNDIVNATSNIETALGHERPKHSEYVNPKKADVKDKVATCQYAVQCIRCDYIIEEKLTNHTTELVLMAAKEVTCTTDGNNEYVQCTGCTYSTAERVYALDHDGQRKDADGKELPISNPDSRPQTCTSRAYCGDCNTEYNYHNESPAHDTKLKNQDSKAADCEVAAYCGICKTYYGNALGHILNWYKAQSPTCEDDGHQEYEACIRKDCEQAKKAYAEAKIEALGHVKKTIAKIEATCTSAGYTEGEYCTRCLVYDKIPQFVPALGHDGQRKGQFDKDDFISPNSVLADCTTRAYCGICKQYYGNYTPIGHHTLETVEAKEPTCEENGFGWYEYVRCKKCSYSTYEENYRAPVGHTNRTIDAKAPTCLDEGHTGGVYCIFCGLDEFGKKYEDGILPALGHDVDFTRNENSKPRTCTEKAYCGDCGEYYGEAPVGHTYADGVPGTCTVKATCVVCGEEFGDYGHLIRPDGSCYYCGKFVKKED